MSLSGTVKTFQPDKGFGFVVTPDGQEVFLHISGCTDGGIPQKGDTLTFDMAESPVKPGQMQASNITGGTGTKGGGKGSGATGGSIQGTVKSFVEGKGYGFIVGPDGVDVFLHIRAMVDGSAPQKGDTVMYDVKPSDSKPGQMVASNVAGGTGWPTEGGGGGGGGWGKGGGKSDWGPYGGGWGGGKDAKGKGKMQAKAEMMAWMWGGWGDDSWGGKGGGKDGGKGGGKGGWW